MNTKLFKLLTAGTFALLSACGEDAATEYDPAQSDPVQTKATLNVLVRDNSTGVPLRASVKMLSTGVADSTSAAMGKLSFKDISSGSHRLLVEKEGYASAVYDAYVAFESNQNIFIAQETSVDLPLFPLTSSLDGYVYYEDINGISKPAKDAEVRVVLDFPEFMEKVFTATVGTDGKFVFSKLPAVGNQYTLQVLEIAKDGQTYKAQELSGPSLANGLPAHMTSAIKYTDLVAFFDLMEYKTIVNSTEAISLVFSDDIDADKFKPSMVSFQEYIPSYYSPINLPVDKAVSGKTLTLTLVNSKWPSSFRISLNGLISAKGKSFSDYTSRIDVVSVSIAASTVTLRKAAGTISATSMGVDLEWDKVTGATGYKLYARASAGSNEFVFIKDVGNVTSGTVDVGNGYYSCSYDQFTCYSSYICYNLGFVLYSSPLYNYATCPFADGNYMEFIVQAYNSSSETKLNGVTPLKVVATP